jgi:hypothetical protein
MKIQPLALSTWVKKYYFMNPIQKDMFEKDPEKFIGQQKEMSDHN